MNAINSSWATGDKVQPLGLISLLELESLAAQIIPAAGFDYIVGGAGAEQTLAENRASFDRRFVTQRVLTGSLAAFYPRHKNKTPTCFRRWGFRNLILTMTYSHMGKPHTTIGDASFHC